MTTRSTAAAAALAALGLTPLAAAQTLEFEDLTPNDTYSYLDSFVTEGVTVEVNDYNGNSGGSATVENPNFAGAGNGMFISNAMLDFDFDFPLTTIGFAFHDHGGSIRLSVNGDEVQVDDPSQYHNTVQGGANISVALTVTGGEFGFVTIQGAITEFGVGGQEFSIDDVRRIPTPGASSILALGALAAARRRRRR